MERKIEHHETVMVMAIQAHIEIVELEEGLYLARRQSASEEIPSKNNKRKNFVDRIRSHWSGLVNAQGRQELLDGNIPSPENILNLTWLSSLQIQQLATHGYLHVLSELQKNKGNGLNIWKQWSENPAMSLDGLVQLDHSTHRVYDRYGQPLPVMVAVDYISGGISESTYDMEKLYEHLVSRSDIRVAPGRSRNFHDVDTWEDAKDFNDAVYHIPDYNQEEGRETSLQFIWIPTAEDFAKLADHGNLDLQYHLMNSNILGTEKFRIGE